MKKIGENSIEFDKVYLKSTGVVAGPLEGKGPLSSYFDYIYEHEHCGCKNWEKAEMILLSDAIDYATTKAGLNKTDIDLYIGGDLNNQLAANNYVMRNIEVPFLGVYSACSTLTAGIIVGSTFLESGYGENIVTMTSSHNATSERQFRYPTEYGGQKPETMTFTISGAGATVLSKDKAIVKITKATIGKVIDLKQTDVQDMGRAMAPAAALTLKQHLLDFNILPNEYDLIVTGDLSKYGKNIFIKILRELNINVEKNYEDCGLMVYDKENNNVFAGGSGCGCSTLVTLGYLYNAIKTGKYHRILVIATGALHNPIMIAQKESIPCIAHAIVLERC